MQIDALIDRLATFEPGPYPVLSLYLDARPDDHGRERYGAFARKELGAHAQAYAARSRERESYDRDAARIRAWLETEARPSANGIAIFACAGSALFEAVQLEAPIASHELTVGAFPRVTPLAQLADAYRRYAAVVLDTHTARIFVFALGELEATDTIETPAPRRSDQGGWAQARYQRHVDNFAVQHVKEVVDALDAVVRTERIHRVVLAGDEVVIPLVRDQLPRPLADAVGGVVRLDVDAGEREVRDRTLHVVRAADARADADKVTRVLDAARAGGLGTSGVDATRAALANGQVHELLISPDALGAALADDLVITARRTSAVVTFIEDAHLLDAVEGVAARLRYRIGGKAA